MLWHLRARACYALAFPGTCPSGPTQEQTHKLQLQQLQDSFAAMLQDTLIKLEQRLEERHTAQAPAAR